MDFPCNITAGPVDRFVGGVGAGVLLLWLVSPMERSITTETTAEQKAQLNTANKEAKHKRRRNMWIGVLVGGVAGVALARSCE